MARLASIYLKANSPTVLPLEHHLVVLGEKDEKLPRLIGTHRFEFVGSGRAEFLNDADQVFRLALAAAILLS